MRTPLLLLGLAAPVLALPLAALSPAALARPAHAARAAAHHPAATHAAAPAAGNAPKPIGKFDSWEAATLTQGGQPICYAFTHATSSTPRLPGRGDVVMTVTQRPGNRDVVAISAGYAYPHNAEVMLQVERASFPFYTAQNSAFARDGHAVVAAFLKAGQATARGPGPHSGQVVDVFSLRGFAPALKAINKACPAH